MKKNIEIEKLIEKRIKLGRPLIGFGLAKPDITILRSLARAKKYADILLVGPPLIKNVKGFKKVISTDPEKEISKMLFDHKVGGIVRGTIDDVKTFEAYESLVGSQRVKEMSILALLKDYFGRHFFLSQVVNSLGGTRREKIRDVQGIIKFFKEELKLEPKVGFLTGIRKETYLRKKRIKTGVQATINKTYADAEYAVKYFLKNGVRAHNFQIEIETALSSGYNIIVPPNGMVGNQIFRTLTLIGGGKVLTGTRANLPHPYEDNSRSEKDFVYHIKWLVAWINGRKSVKTNKH